MWQPQNITKLNEHADIFMEERPANGYQGGRGLGRPFILRKHYAEVNYCLCGSSRISKILAFFLQSLAQCLAHSRCLILIDRKKGDEMAREARPPTLSDVMTLKSLIRGTGTRA